MPTTTAQIENIIDGLEPIALILKSQFDMPGLHFFTPPNFSQQVAYMRHPKGKRIAPHVHNLLPRQVLYTQEVLFIRKGKVKVYLYSSNKTLVCERILESGDLILLAGRAFI